MQRIILGSQGRELDLKSLVEGVCKDSPEKVGKEGCIGLCFSSFGLYTKGVREARCLSMSSKIGVRISSLNRLDVCTLSLRRSSSLNSSFEISSSSEITYFYRPSAFNSSIVSYDQGR
jgi:hypothetical protein